MSRCAVVQNSDDMVVNVIIADLTDPPPEGCFLVLLSDDQFVNIGWFYDPSTGEFFPPPEERE